MQARIRSVVNHPLTALVPWIVLALLAGPGRFELAAGIAFAMSVVLVVAGRLLSSSLKFLEVVDVLFFGAMVVAAIFASDGTIHWLETYSGELSNIVLAVFALGTMAIGIPFTIQYAREETPKEYWSSPHFLRVNMVITGAWALAFLVNAAAGAIGDLVLDNSNNLWTGWVIQAGSLITAVSFTAWYAAVGRARSLQAQGQSAEEPPISAMLVPLIVWIPVMGILLLAFDAGPSWLGVAFIVAGVLLGGWAHRARTSEPQPAS